MSYPAPTWMRCPSKCFLNLAKELLIPSQLILSNLGLILAGNFRLYLSFWLEVWDSSFIEGGYFILSVLWYNHGWYTSKLSYRVGSQLLTMTVQLNVYYYGNKQDHSKSIHTDRLDICECVLVYLHLEDLAYCHNKTHLTELSKSVASQTPCTYL